MSTDATTRSTVVSKAGRVLEGYFRLPDQDDWSAEFAQMFEDVGAVLEGAAALPRQLTSIEDLAAWNKTRGLLEWITDDFRYAYMAEVSDPAAFEAIHTEVADLLGDFFGVNMRSDGTEALEPVLVEALWCSLTYSGGIRPEDLMNPLLSELKESAASILTGTKALVRVAPDPGGSRPISILNDLLAITPGSDVLLVPLGVLLAVSGVVTEVVNVGLGSTLTDRRVEALSALVSAGTDGAALADLWEATSEL